MNQNNFLIFSNSELNFLCELVFQNKLQIPEKLDYKLFLKMIQQNRLEQVVYAKLKKIESVDKTFISILNEICNEIIFTNLEFLEKIIEIEKLFRENKIQCIFLKGLILSKQIYGNFTFRTCRDIDVLVDVSDLEVAKSVLIKAGFSILGANYNTVKQKKYLVGNFHHLNFIHENSEIVVELHWNISPVHSLEIIKFQKECIKNKELLEINSLKLFHLNDIDEFIFLCIHGCRHLWFRLFWLKDIQEYLNQNDDLFLKKVLEKAKLYKLEKYIFSTFEILNSFENSQNLYSQKDNEKIIQSGKLTKVAISAIEKSSLFSEQSLLKMAFLHYKMIFLLDGFNGIFREIYRRRIKPENWNYFVFSDRFFRLNLVFSRSIWALRKLKNKT